MNTAHYFYRNIIFSKKENQISLININNPEETEILDPWFSMVIQLADGQHTIAELLIFIKNQYKSEVPPNLKNTLESIMKKLIESKFIVLTEEKTDLPYYLSMPYELLDLDKAKKLLARDRENIS